MSKKGQMTVEFILIMVVMLAVLGSVTFPIVNSMTDSARDTSRAVALASAQRRIINTAEEVSMGSCGSFKTVGIYIPPEVLSEPNLLWDKTHVWGNFTNSTSDSIALRKLEYPIYIKIEGGAYDGDTPPACTPNCVPAKNNTFFVTIRKDCSATRPTDICPNLNGIGVGIC